MSKNRVIRCDLHNKPVLQDDEGCPDFDQEIKQIVWMPKKCIWCKHSK